MITLISQTTTERQAETVQLFDEIKPLLDSGIPFYRAIKKVKNIHHNGFLGQAWYRELRDYAETQGYYTRWSKPGKLVNGGYRL